VVTVVAAAPRIDPRLRRMIARTDRPARPIAETCRRVGARAERLGLARPSYEQVRVHVHASRARAAAASAVHVVFDVSVRLRPTWSQALAAKLRRRPRGDGVQRAKLAPRPRLRR
jgi:hypothetical protein